MQTLLRLANRGMDWLSDVVLLFLRAWLGYQLAVAGWGKLNNIETPTAFFTKLGIPYPHANAIFVGSVELVGGALLAIGLISRLAAIPVTGAMCVAIGTAFRERLMKMTWGDPEMLTGTDPFPFLLLGGAVLFLGPGMLSVDGLVAWLEGHAIRTRFGETGEYFMALWMGRGTAARLE